MDLTERIKNLIVTKGAIFSLERQFEPVKKLYHSRMKSITLNDSNNNKYMQITRAPLWKFGCLEQKNCTQRF